MVNEVILLVIGVVVTWDAGPTPPRHYFLDESLRTIGLGRKATMPRLWDHDPIHALADNVRVAVAQVRDIARLELMNVHAKGDDAVTVKSQTEVVTPWRGLPTLRRLPREWTRRQCLSGCGLPCGCTYRARVSSATGQLRMKVHTRPAPAAKLRGGTRQSPVPNPTRRAAARGMLSPLSCGRTPSTRTSRVRTADCAGPMAVPPPEADEGMQFEGAAKRLGRSTPSTCAGEPRTRRPPPRLRKFEGPALGLGR